MASDYSLFKLNWRAFFGNFGRESIIERQWPRIHGIAGAVEISIWLRKKKLKKHLYKIYVN